MPASNKHCPRINTGSTNSLSKWMLQRVIKEIRYMFFEDWRSWCNYHPEHRWGFGKTQRSSLNDVDANYIAHNHSCQVWELDILGQHVQNFYTMPPNWVNTHPLFLTPILISNHMVYKSQVLCSRVSEDAQFFFGPQIPSATPTSRIVKTPRTLVVSTGTRAKLPGLSQPFWDTWQLCIVYT